MKPPNEKTTKGTMMDDYDRQLDDRDNCVMSDDVPLDGDHDSTMTSIGWGTDEDYGSFDNDW